MLADGFAMASTDTGHEGNTPDANQFWRNELAVINYGYRSIHLTTVLAKQLINGFYGEENPARLHLGLFEWWTNGFQ